MTHNLWIISYEIIIIPEPEFEVKMVDIYDILYLLLSRQYRFWVDQK